ncbi:MAG: CDP-glucose 4,6-dehydratase [Candidatus Marinimicrobia bacterium]|nr:CDP-glucose 4,6-dehydratase [Candidatus Neomarinimicrobiota bacterium]MCF7828747.1 CDP-glucose 4,6-dehydratase [Candidatus Neomarinimicrobiota bacterium]MCF7880664.1 CDP-glucose 4,6-dehydratase [Candidatus Neomarinimicrobiota bacterium]
MVKFLEIASFFKDKKVLITGHTGFKGSWLSLVLNQFDAKINGYALEPPTIPSLFEEAGLDDIVESKIGDVRNLEELTEFIHNVDPEFVIHMAAQPLVRDSYEMPVETYETNVIGTVNLLEACRKLPSLKVIINVTTDKCYENQEWHWGYREYEPMGGYDPYSNSKGCSELVTSAYRRSFYNPIDYEEHGVAVATARAGNVIGGGDWASDRLIPDFIRAISEQQKFKIRNPHAIRPWQHVMEPVMAYLVLARMLYLEGPHYSGAWNFGPNDDDVKNVEWIAKTICNLWGEGASYKVNTNTQPHEANYLKLDCSKAKAELNWNPKWDINMALSSIVEWNKARLAGKNVRQITERQINRYLT